VIAAVGAGARSATVAEATGGGQNCAGEDDSAAPGRQAWLQDEKEEAKYEAKAASGTAPKYQFDDDDEFIAEHFHDIVVPADERRRQAEVYLTGVPGTVEGQGAAPNRGWANRQRCEGRFWCGGTLITDFADGVGFISWLAEPGHLIMSDCRRLDWPATVSKSFAMHTIHLPCAGCCHARLERCVNLPRAAARSHLTTASWIQTNGSFITIFVETLSRTFAQTRLESTCQRRYDFFGESDIQTNARRPQERR
jgi:hypothetical protein